MKIIDLPENYTKEDVRNILISGEYAADLKECDVYGNYTLFAILSASDHDVTKTDPTHIPVCHPYIWAVFCGINIGIIPLMSGSVNKLYIVKKGFDAQQVEDDFRKNELIKLCEDVYDDDVSLKDFNNKLTEMFNFSFKYNEMDTERIKECGITLAFLKNQILNCLVEQHVNKVFKECYMDNQNF